MCYKKIKNLINDSINNNLLILILEKINDPRNLGSCLRTAYSFNVNYIIITNFNTCSINKTVIKTSCGYSKYLKIIKINNINKILNILKKNNIYIIGSSLNTNNNIFDINFKILNSIAIIIGSENNGISNKSIKNCNILIKIPMFNKVNSLNLSVATGIFLFEIIRQKLN
ncbi:TrmH family RNA methyltransferase [Candidatus Nardonella dryophthoridicola]|uniref:tRNA/rRNA methyltransferase SpoU type domain-containing protein n=1 Tax=endosymbiont of Metamasius hemipterus TaxID=204627 RepID=A0ABT0TWB4_9GAMM|nr:TrmH family RNA methyltransferase [Candidatus Nardonella dryophthoridicola]MCM0158286.1 hypothetical protein [endosymbiont of Metamasius hemipterus]